MSHPTDPQTESSPAIDEQFGDLLSEFERSHARPGQAGQQMTGTVIAISADTVFVDIGSKTEGTLPLAIFTDSSAPVAVGDRFPVSIKARGPEGFLELSRIRVEQPKDWDALEKAFADRAVIVGTVIAVVKGGLTVDIGVRAFMPASRSGAADAEAMEKLVDQEIRCRITKLDSATEDVVVDRRAVNEEEDRANRERRYSEITSETRCRGPFAASQTMAPSSTSVEWTACFTSGRSRGPAWGRWRTSSPQGRRSPSRS